MGIQSHTIFRRSVAKSLANEQEDSFQRDSPETLGFHPTASGIKYGSQSMVPRSPHQAQDLLELQKLNEAYEYDTIRRLREKSNRTIATISSVFPFDFFPNTIEVEENKINVILRQFFGCSRTHSIDMRDIANIFIETAPFFATIRITTRNFVENDVTIQWLKRREAIYARNIMEGLRIFSQERVDTSKYELSDLVKRLEDLSTIKIMMQQA